MHDRVSVIGAGSWGTTLAMLLAQNGYRPALHCWPPEIARTIRDSGRNLLYFPDVALPTAIQPTADLAEALDGCTTAYLVVPTRYLREFIRGELHTLSTWAATQPILCNCTKGLLLEPTERVDAWLAGLLPQVRLCHLAGPNFASELIVGKPAAAVVAGDDQAARDVQRQLMSDCYRIYTGGDMVGVEVAGFYKNIIAIAAGAVSELGLGENARASLVTRAVSEMNRLVAYFGGQPATLMGLAGIGDLLLTCGSAQSRNFQVGVRRAQGQGLSRILDEMTQVAEGIEAARAVHQWPADHGLSGWPELPIAEEVYRIVYAEADPRESMARLMRRPPKAE